MGDPNATSTSAGSSGGDNFWKLMGVQDEFDRCHIVANIERFCSLYNIRGAMMEGGLLLEGDSVLVASSTVKEEEVGVATNTGKGKRGSSKAAQQQQQQLAMKEMRRMKAEERERDREGERISRFILVCIQLLIRYIIIIMPTNITSIFASYYIYISVYSISILRIHPPQSRRKGSPRTIPRRTTSTQTCHEETTRGIPSTSKGCGVTSCRGIGAVQSYPH